MTVTTDTAIVPAMSRTGHTLWTPDGPRIVTPDNPDGPVRPTGTDRTGPDRPEAAGPDVPVQPDDTAPDGPVHPYTDVATAPDAPADQDAHTRMRAQDGPVHPADDTPDNEDDAMGDTLEGLTKADQIRHVFRVLHSPTSAQVRDWLAAHSPDEFDPDYVRKIVRAERRRRGMTDTQDLPALTEEALAELDAADMEARPEPPAPSPPEPPLPAESTPAVVADLAARVREAQARLPLQADPSLLTALSDEEIQKERELAEWERQTDRDIRRAAKAAELARAKRDQATAEHIAKSENNDARWHQRALSARRRLTSPDARLAQLHRNASWSARALIGVVLLGMVWSGVNVQHNLVPSGDMSDPLYWLSYGIEAMISVPLIVIMVAATTAARWGRELPRRAVVPVELTLLAITVGLNAGPHIIGTPEPSRALEYAIAPVMVGVVIWLHAWVSQHYAKLLGSDGNGNGEQP